MKKSSITRTTICLFLTLLWLSYLLTGIIVAAGLCTIKDISEDNGRELGRVVAGNAEQALKKAACEQLMATAAEKALYIEERFREATAYVRGIAAQAEAIYGEPEKYPDREVPPPVKGSTRPAAQLIRSERLAEPSREQLQEIWKLGNLQDLLVQYIANNDMVSSACLATESGWVMVADYTADSKYEEGSDMPISFEAGERQWYQRAAQAGQGQIVYMDVTEDCHGGDGCIMGVQPVFRRGELVAVAGVEFCLDAVSEVIRNTAVGETGYAFLINQHGQILVSPREDGETAAGRNIDLREEENEALAQVVTDILFKEGGLEELTLDGRRVYMAYVPLMELGWGVFTVMDVEEVTAPAMAGEEQIRKLGEAAALRQDGVIRAIMAALIIILGASALVVSGAVKLLGKHITGQPVYYNGRAVIENLPKVTALVEQAMCRHSFSAGDIKKVLVAVDEIYSNICFYSQATEVWISCEVSEEEARVIFTDDGIPYDPLGKPDPDPGAKDPPIGGMGIYIVKKTMDQVVYEYEYSRARNRLTIVKHN